MKPKPSPRSKKAKTTQELNQEALVAAQSEMKTIQADWESAKLARDEAQQKLDKAAEDEHAERVEAFAQAETHFLKDHREAG